MRGLLMAILASGALLGASAGPAQAGTTSIARSPQVGSSAPPSVTLGQVSGVFYPNPADRGSFDSGQLDRPLFSLPFPVIDFDPPASIQGACARPTHVGELTRPYTDVISAGAGRCDTEVAAGRGARAGVGALSSFEAVYQTTVRVSRAEDVTFHLRSDDGWILAIGPDGAGRQPSHVSGALRDPPPAGPVSGYPVVGAYNVASSPGDRSVTVSFPGSGEYPVEVDYTECCGGQDVLVLGTSSTAIPRPPKPRSAPTVTSVRPDAGPRAGGTRLTITGSGFSTFPGGTGFRFGAHGRLATSVSCASSSDCTAISPPGSGTVDVSATVDARASTGNPVYRYTAQQAPSPGEFVEVPPALEPEPGSPLRPRTPPPDSLAGLPIGIELVPKLAVEVRLRPGEPLPTSFKTLEGANFVHIGSLAIDATCICGLDGERQLFGEDATLGAQIGFSEPPEEEGSGSGAAFALPVAELSVTTRPLPAVITTPVVPEARLKATLTVSVQLYRQQAADYAAAKLAEGAAGVVSEVLTDGAITSVLDALAPDPAMEIAWKVAQYRELAHRVASEMHVTLDSLALVGPVVRIVHEEIGPLLKEVIARLGSDLRQALTWVAERARRRAEKLFREGRWVVEVGGRTLAKAGRVVAGGWRVGTGVSSGGRPLLSREGFEAATPHQLEVTSVRSLGAFGFGLRALSRTTALVAARALVKYDLPLATVRPLLVSTLTPRAGHLLCVAGGRLSEYGTADIELTGPGYRGSRLVRTEKGVGGGCVRLPARMAPGQWFAALVDYSTHAAPSGVLADVFPFTMRAHGRRSTSATAWTLIGLGIAAALLLGALVAFGLMRARPARGRRRQAGALRARARAAIGSSSPTDVVVVCVGVALAVFFAGATAAVAAGQSPPSAMWAAGAALAGGLLGLLAPPPGSAAARTRAASDAAAAAAGDADDVVREAGARVPAVADVAETKGAACLLLAVFVLMLALGVVLSAGAIAPPAPFVESLKGITTAVIALASASGGALLGMLAPSPGKAR